MNVFQEECKKLLFGTFFYFFKKFNKMLLEKMPFVPNFEQFPRWRLFQNWDNFVGNIRRMVFKKSYLIFPQKSETITFLVTLILGFAERKIRCIDFRELFKVNVWMNGQVWCPHKSNDYHQETKNEQIKKERISKTRGRPTCLGLK